MNLETAQKFAAEVHAVIVPLCEKCEIAGSIRRQKREDIKDIEIVAIPSLAGYGDLKRVVNSKWGLPDQGRFPSKYTRIRGLAKMLNEACESARNKR